MAFIKHYRSSGLGDAINKIPTPSVIPYVPTTLVKPTTPPTSLVIQTTPPASQPILTSPVSPTTPMAMPSGTPLATIPVETSEQYASEGGMLAPSVNQPSMPSMASPVSSQVATLKSIAVTPINPTLGVGATGQFSAIGTYSDGSTQDITQSVMWNVSDPSIISINATGLVTALKIGPATIAAIDQASGILGTNTMTVTAAGTPATATAPAIQTDILTSASTAIGISKTALLVGGFAIIGLWLMGGKRN